MRKLNRFLALGLGLIAAACGDDVTVVPPPPPPEPPPPGIRSVSVAPNGATITAGQSLQFSAAVVTDPGAATPTIAWTTTAAAAVGSISATGLFTSVAAAPTTSVSVTATATSGTSVASGNATLNIQAAPVCAITGVVVSPANATVSAGQSITAVATVSGTNCTAAQLANVTWSLASGNPAHVTVGAATGVITIAANATAGVAVVRATSNVDNTKSGTISLVITVPDPATVSIESVTYVPPPCLPPPAPAGTPPPPATTCGGSNSIPVNLLNVFGQIEVTANVNAGGQQLARLDVLIGGQVVASQTFPGTAAPADPESAAAGMAPVLITLSTNTQQVRAGTLPGPCGGMACVPVVFNGNKQITLNLYVAGQAQPLASNAVPVVMNNRDESTAPTTLVDAANAGPFEPAAGNAVSGGAPWFTGATNISGGTFIAFTNTFANPIAGSVFSYTAGGTAGCAASSSAVAGTPATGIALSGVYACASVEGSLTTGAGIAPFAVTYPAPNGPDGTALIAPLWYSTLGSAFLLNQAGSPVACPPPPGPPPAGCELRWNLVPQNGLPVPAPAALGPHWVDNLAPAFTSFSTIAANASFDQWWLNANNNLPSFWLFTDGGSGPTNPTAEVRVWDPANTLVHGGSGPHVVTGAQLTNLCTGAPIVTPGGVPLTPSSTNIQAGGAFRFCARATDNLMNTSLWFGSNAARTASTNFAGYDNVVPVARLAGSMDPPGTVVPTFVGVTGHPTPVSGPTATTMLLTGVTRYNVAGEGHNPSQGAAGQVTVASGGGLPVGAWSIEGQDPGPVPASGFDQALLVASRPAAQNVTRSNSTGFGTSLAASCLFTNNLTALLSDGWRRNTSFAIPDCGTGTNGVFTYTGSVWDRALNQSAVISRTYVIDRLVRPAITGLGFPTAVLGDGTGSTITTGTFTISAADDIDINDAIIGFDFPAANFPTGGQTGVRYPYLGVFGDVFARTSAAQFVTVLNGAPVQHGPYIGRFDETCTGLAAPYPTCAQPAATAAEFLATPGLGAIAPGNYLAGTAWQPTSAYASVRDGGRNYPSAAAPAGIVVPMLATQTMPILSPWSAANTFNFIATIAATTVTVSHYTPSSLTLPFFEQVQLWRLALGAGPLGGNWIFCGVVSPQMSGVLVFDNGTYRIWRWTLTTPTTGLCAEVEGSAGVAGTWRVLGVRGAAGLFTPTF